MSDKSKPPIHLVPLCVLNDLARVMEAGNKKPDRKPDDWKTMPDAQNRLLSACIRHLGAWQYGEKADPESRLSHLAHAATNLVMMLWHEGREKPIEIPATTGVAALASWGTCQPVKPCEHDKHQWHYGALSGKEVRWCARCGEMQ